METKIKRSDMSWMHWRDATAQTRVMRLLEPVRQDLDAWQQAFDKFKQEEERQKQQADAADAERKRLGMCCIGFKRDPAPVGSVYWTDFVTSVNLPVQPALP